MSKFIQFISILPPKEVLLEVPLEEVPDDLIDKDDLSYGYADQTIRVEGKACRLKLIEKDSEK